MQNAYSGPPPAGAALAAPRAQSAQPMSTHWPAGALPRGPASPRTIAREATGRAPTGYVSTGPQAFVPASGGAGHASANGYAVYPPTQQPQPSIAAQHSMAPANVPRATSYAHRIAAHASAGPDGCRVQCACGVTTFPAGTVPQQTAQCSECRKWQHAACAGLDAASSQAQRAAHLCAECRLKYADPFWQTAGGASGWVVPLRTMRTFKVRPLRRAIL